MEIGFTAHNKPPLGIAVIIEQNLFFWHIKPIFAELTLDISNKTFIASIYLPWIIGISFVATWQSQQSK